MQETKSKSAFGALILIITMVVSPSCGSKPEASEYPTSTPTPTKAVQVVPPTQTETPSKCAGLSGELEIQILVGPAEAVGLTPHSVGSIPFSVTSDEAPYPVQGGGSFDYGDILVKEWGTYEVTMEMSGSVNGTCSDSESGEELTLGLELIGSQLVVVTSDGFSSEYPWEGTLPFDLVFPIEEGASFEGEGYVIVLHLN